MAKKLTMKDLLAAYKELDEQIGVEPPIDKKLSQDAFEQELYDVISDPELVTEDDEFTTATQAVFDQLIEKYGNVEEEPEEEEEPEPIPVKKGKAKPVPVVEDDEDEPEPTPVKKGKKPVVVEDDEDEPEPVKPSKKPVTTKPIPKAKPVPVEEEDEDEPAPVKKGKVKENVSSSKKENVSSKKGMSRPEAVALAIKQNSKLKSIEEWAVAANHLYEKSGGLSNVAKMKADITYFACILRELNIPNIPTK